MLYSIILYNIVVFDFFWSFVRFGQNRFVFFFWRFRFRLEFYWCFFRVSKSGDGPFVRHICAGLGTSQRLGALVEFPLNKVPK